MFLGILLRRVTNCTGPFLIKSQRCAKWLWLHYVCLGVFKIKDLLSISENVFIMALIALYSVGAVGYSSQRKLRLI